MYNSFSQSLMKKYGWTQGDGLGKNNQGITEPIKANLKFDSHGLSYKEIDSDQTSKWSNMYTAALSSLQVENDNCITLIKKDEDAEKLNSIGVNVLYKSFIKSNVYMKDGLEVKQKKEKKSKRKRTLDTVEDGNNDVNVNADAANEAVPTAADATNGKKKKKKRPVAEDPTEPDKSEAAIAKPDKKSKKCTTVSDNTGPAIADDADTMTTRKLKKKKRPVAEDPDESEAAIAKPHKKSKKCTTASDNTEPVIADDADTMSTRKPKKKKRQSDLLETNQSSVVPNSTFMTCYPAARCGIGMSGKLARIQKLHDEEERRKRISTNPFP